MSTEKMKKGGKIRPFLNSYASLAITRCAETGSVPPEFGIRVKAVAAPAGLRTVITAFSELVVIIDIPTIWEPSAERPATV